MLCRKSAACVMPMWAPLTWMTPDHFTGDCIRGPHAACLSGFRRSARALTAGTFPSPESYRTTLIYPSSFTSASEDVGTESPMKIIWKASESFGSGVDSMDATRFAEARHF